MIGTWKDSAELGVVGISLWTVAYAWYFIGTNRIKQSWGRLVARLSGKPAAAKRPDKGKQH